MILIVDGDREAAASLERVLKFNHFQVVTIAAGMDALALLETQRPRLIVLDLEITGIDGMLLLQAIRHDLDFAAVPILIYTKIFAEEKRQQAIRFGANDVIVKGTIGWRALVEKIRVHYPDLSTPPS